MAGDPLTYAQLSESNITSKLPEIAYRQYQIGEAKREKEKKDATDLAAAFKEQKDTWDADNIYLKKTWERNVNAASEYFGRTRDADGARLMFMKGQNLSNALVSSSSDQQKLYDIAAKQQLQNQKIMGKDPEGFKRDAEMLQQYVTLNGVPKEVYKDVRKRFSIPKEMTDEEIRPLVRQEYFKDKQLISFTPLPSFQEGLSEYALNPEAYSSVYKDKVGDIEGVTTAHGTKYNPEALKKQKELFWDFGREKSSGIQYKLDYIRTLKQTNPNITEAEAKQHFMNNKSWDELLKKGAESRSMSFNERNKSDSFSFGLGSGEDNKFISTIVDKTGEENFVLDKTTGKTSLSQKSSKMDTGMVTFDWIKSGNAENGKIQVSGADNMYSRENGSKIELKPNQEVFFIPSKIESNLSNLGNEKKVFSRVSGQMYQQGEDGMVMTNVVMPLTQTIKSKINNQLKFISEDADIDAYINKSVSKLRKALDSGKSTPTQQTQKKTIKSGGLNLTGNTGN